MKLKAAIFDLDGVIVDTAKYHYMAWKRLAEELGFFFSKDHNEKLKGVSRMRSLEIMLEIGGLTYSENEMAAMAEKKNNWYREFITHLKPEEMLPGAEEFILFLRKNSIPTALGSASKNALTILDKLKITSLFNVIIDGTKVSRVKPDPEVFLRAAAELKIEPADCIVFEDAEAGIEAAHNAGMSAVGIGSPDNLGQAEIVIPSLADFDRSILEF